MNGIIHPCSHPNDDDPHFRITEAEIFKNIFNYIEVPHFVIAQIVSQNMNYQHPSRRSKFCKISKKNFFPTAE